MNEMPPTVPPPKKNGLISKKANRPTWIIMIVSLVVVISILATAFVLKNRKSDSYRLGYQSGVDWTTSSAFPTGAGDMPLATSCGYFSEFVSIANSGGPQTYASAMAGGITGNYDPALVALPVPANRDFSETQFLSGCEDGARSTSSGASYYRNRN
jgi:hypothetical protein